MPEPTWLQRAAVPSLFTALTAIMTWPQPVVLATQAADHHDVLFNLWRLRWIAHALATSPARLFDGNIFHPEPLALTLSDAILVQGVLGAPLFWLGLPPVLVHNLLLLGAIVASATGMFVLARHLTGSTAGAIAAGVVFAFAPYRVEHYMHMELQWAVWLPWAFWALQRTIDTASIRFGLLTGLFVALQVLSSIYYGVFLALILPVVALLQLLPRPWPQSLAILKSLTLGAVLAAALAGIYAVPYSRTSARVDERTTVEVTRYSAKPKDYLIATAGNLLYADRGDGLPERRLFPGFVAPLLALVGLLLVVPRPAIVAYVVGGVVAFEISLGMYGLIYPFLYERFGIFQSLRAPARASIFCLLVLGVLAAHGSATLISSAGERLKTALGGALVAAMLLEYWVAPIALVPVHNRPPALYAWLAGQPPGVVAEFPMAPSSNLPGPDPVYAYMSTFHWQPLLNGYSGYYPRPHLQRLDVLTRFPDPRAIARLREYDVRYVVVHPARYDGALGQQALEGALAAGLGRVAEFDDGHGRAVVFQIR